MMPVLFEVGGVPIHTYGVLGAVGFLVVTFLLLRRGRALGYDREAVIDVVFWGAIAGIVGSRLLFVVQHLDRMRTWSDWIDVRSGGLVFYGALIAGLPTVWLLCRRHGIPFLPFMDATATALPIGHALARVGCLAAGCCYGRPTDLPWAVTFHGHSGTDVPAGVPLHPTQLYEAGWLLVVAVLLAIAWPKRRFDGQITAMYLALYGVGRAVIEAFRGDPDRGWFLEPLLGHALSLSQGLSLVAALFAAAVVVVGVRRAQRL